jgi:multiple sugar transport system permease protein
MAALLNSKHLWAKKLFRTLFYMPYMVPLVSAVLAWSGFLNDQTGWLNYFLELIGINGPDWINSTIWIYPALLIMGLWGNGNAMITLLAGMQNVPTEIYEAARVDGANGLTIFFKITLPMITPVIFYNLILSVVGLMQYFLEPYVLTNGTGDPGNATMFFNLYMFQNFFKFYDMAYGATLAWVLFVIILLITIAVFGTRKFWVYEAESR